MARSTYTIGTICIQIVLVLGESYVLCTSCTLIDRAFNWPARKINDWREGEGSREAANK